MSADATARPPSPPSAGGPSGVPARSGPAAPQGRPAPPRPAPAPRPPASADADLLPLLVDAHAHHIDSWAPAARHRFIATGYSPESNEGLLSLLSPHGSCPRAWLSLGFGPQELQRADRYPDLPAALARFEAQVMRARRDPLLSRRLVAIGEVGLDAHWGKTEADRTRQFEAFERILQLSNRERLPVVIHSRDAEESCLKMLLAAHAPKALMHCFGGTLAQAQAAAEAGYLVSIPPLPNAERKRIIRALPLSSLAVESDAPYIGKDSGLGALESAKMVARYRGIEVKEAVEATARNVADYFGLGR